MAETHLASGHDVIVPQFLAREAFIEGLEQLAMTVGADFVEVVLHLDREDAINAFLSRQRNPENQNHEDANVLVDRAMSLIAGSPSEATTTVIGDIAQPGVNPKRSNDSC